MTFVLDTHTLLWWQAGGERLSAKARRAAEGAESLLLSAISCWEIAFLFVKGRIRLDRDVHQWVRDLADERVRVVPVSQQIATVAGVLSAQGMLSDPADAIIYATAREAGVPVVTKDRSLRDFAKASGDVRTVW